MSHMPQQDTYLHRLLDVQVAAVHVVAITILEQHEMDCSIKFFQRDIHHFLFHGLKFLSVSIAGQVPSKVIARSSRMTNAAGFSRTNRTSSRPEPAGDSYHAVPALACSQLIIAFIPPGWLLRELNITTSKYCKASSMKAMAPGTGGSGMTSAPFQPDV